METKPNYIVADSSGLISLAVATDMNHAAALSAARDVTQSDKQILVPAEVFAETLNILGKKFGHQYAAGTVQTILDSSAFAVVPTTSAVRADAVVRFVAAPGRVSFTDCLVMAVADVHDTREVFGFDKDIRKHGYQLPSPEKRAA